MAESYWGNNLITQVISTTTWRTSCFLSLVALLIKAIKAYFIIKLWKGHYHTLRAKSGVFESLVK